MQPQKAEQMLSDAPQQAAQPRFQIEKLEERIAPWGCAGKINPQGKCVGGGPRRPDEL